MKQNTPRAVRCAIYCRKSSDENLSLEFNSLDAQRMRCERSIGERAHMNWICLPETYDDGGYSGGTVERPALKRLLADIEKGLVDVVVVYRLDRLSRSLFAFGDLFRFFEKHGVSFISATEVFDSTTPGGRFFMQQLVLMAEYERSLGSERTRHKIEASRRQGLWTGGPPLLGYDIVRTEKGSRLVVNVTEADEVRRIYALYIELGSLIPTVQALAAKGITTKKWITSGGKSRGGIAIDKTRLHQMLTNPIYIGRIRHHDNEYEGQHQRIIDDRTWKRVQTQLQANALNGGNKCRNVYGATLRDLLFCGTCGTKMLHAYSQKRGVRYRYYVCQRAQKHGWSSCTTKSIPAREIEKFVLDEIRAIGSNPEVAAATIERIREGVQESLRELKAERGRLTQRSRRDQKALPKATNEDHLADLNEQIAADAKRLPEIEEEIARLESAVPSSDQIMATLADFDTVWQALAPIEQVRLINLLIQRVEFNGPAGTIQITYHPTALQLLQHEVGKRSTEAAA